MRRFVYLLLLAAFALVLASCNGEQAGGQERLTELANDTEKLSYAIGMDVARTLERVKDDLDRAALLQGVGDALFGDDLMLTPEESLEIIQTYSEKMREAQTAERGAVGEKNLTEGKEFLAANASEEGVITTASGLQYKVLKEGDGPMPVATDRVKVHYKGTLLDGQEFDSSYKRDEPAVFSVGGLIAGWTEALQLMKVGSQYKLFIPPELAYGDRGAGDMIGPNATLVFDLELLGIEE